MLWLEQFLQDIRFGVRNLAKSSGFTAIAVVSLALGIMAATAIYSVVHGVVLDPFPYKDVDHLMSVKVWEPGQRGFRTYYSADQFLEIAGRNAIFEGTVASTISDVLWTGAGEPQRLRGNHITSGTFEVMGVPALIGRTAGPQDYSPEAPQVTVLGYRFWQRQFGGDPAVLGRSLQLSGKIRTVIGVMPKRFMWRGADVYLPVTLRRGEAVESIRLVHLLGRLKPGVTEARVEADLRPIIEDLKKSNPGQFPEKWRVGLLAFKETFPSAIREALWILFGAVALLLLIACANVSNLLIAKAASRRREIAVRASLGASRTRLLRQLLTESLVLAAAGGLLGVLLALGALKAVVALVPPGTIPDESEIAVNTPVLLFALGVSSLTALVFGLAPALHACSINLADPLRHGRGVSTGFRQALLRNSLVVLEVALSLMLLVGASLMIRTLIAMESVDLGFRADRLLTLRVPLSEQRYPDPERRNLFFRELLRKVSAVPGVAAAGVNTGMHPFGNWNLPVEVAGNPRQDDRRVVIHQTSEEYLKALGIALLKGRVYTASEVAGKQHVALVNQAFVRLYFGGGEALGHGLRIPRLKAPPFLVSDDGFQIVGVVRDTLNRSLTNEIAPEVYLPYTLTGLADRLAVLTRGAPSAAIGAVRSQVYAVDKDQPVTEVKTMEAVLDEWVFSQTRFNLALFAAFAGLGLTLAVIGVYGVISHSVSQQTQEIGVRIALGAGFGSLAGMVLGRGLRLLALGIGLGLVGSLATVRLLSRQIWNVSPFDPVSFAAVSAILLAAGLQACFWPARRAARIDPITALRYE
ncbi:MAG: ABC transporter permease [Acidobacteria bacterium]|nr:ABC transporter permease [Acidobacteriota bacterium]MBI3470030.1 ABC transporter permease [Candidatus Solibacter usitatus]